MVKYTFHEIPDETKFPHTKDPTVLQRVWTATGGRQNPFLLSAISGQETNG